jgi:alpha-tubulin suppressor-like RCC1 family protein
MKNRHALSMNSKRNLISIWPLVTVGLWLAVTSDAQTVTTVAAGYEHSLFLKSDGSLWGMGNDSYGQLGDSTYNQTNQPELILAGNVTAIAAGQYHSLLLQADGSLWAVGFNYYGQLGDGIFNLASPHYGTNQPQKIVTANPVTAIVAGQNHSLFIENDGSLWTMGWNLNGQLGDGVYNTLAPYGTNQPQHIITTNAVTAIAAGDLFSLLVKSDGSLWAMGDNTYGQLGNGTFNQTNRPVLIVTNGVTAVAAGWYHSLFLKTDGSLWAMGANGSGQLGDGTLNSTNRPELIVTNGVVAIAAGQNHSLFLKSDGSLWAMGANGSGQLGDGTINNTNRPEMIVPNHVTAVAGGQNHSLFVKSDGSLWAMGYNRYGQLGDGTTDGGTYQTNRPEPIVGFVSGYDQLAIQLLSNGDAALTFTGLAGTNYALDRTFNLVPPNWVPQATNPAGAGGVLLFTNTPNPATNNFWRVRSVP